MVEDSFLLWPFKQKKKDQQLEANAPTTSLACRPTGQPFLSNVANVSNDIMTVAHFFHNGGLHSLKPKGFLTSHTHPHPHVNM